MIAELKDGQIYLTGESGPIGPKAALQLVDRLQLLVNIQLREEAAKADALRAERLWADCQARGALPGAGGSLLLPIRGGSGAS